MTILKSICVIFMLTFSVLAAVPASTAEHSMQGAPMPMPMDHSVEAMDHAGHDCCESAEDCVMDDCLTGSHCSTLYTALTPDNAAQRHGLRRDNPVGPTRFRTNNLLKNPTPPPKA